MSRRFRKAYPRSCKRWDNTVVTVAAMAPELDPTTEWMGTLNSGDGGLVVRDV
eukprot:CAMPEP_0170800834 /NCGR_PEP_ID=MMETSP0733-20121128/28115_1 /TAXON_ID=186038 /ORGANISM="Fragilariopsis kerguelensis, Strain L26-C5" /LENGTH=52 /DNA_ID=CAMNT_0011153309 /DNA_START=50 /DNA_END=208 /DNA_ORIENTATION=+